MPTPLGKPQAGDAICTANGDVLGTVLRRTPGDLYSVYVRMPNGQEKIITEFEWNMKFRGWTVK